MRHSSLISTLALITTSCVRQWRSAYQHKSYAYRGQRLEELDRFLRRMRSRAIWCSRLCKAASTSERSPGLRISWSWPPRTPTCAVPSRWFNPRERRSREAGCVPPFPALLQSQAYIVDLTEAYDQLAALVPHSEAAQAARRGRAAETRAELHPHHARLRR